MDRYDAQTIAAFLLTSVGICLNLMFLQAAEAMGSPRAPLVLVPIFAGLTVDLSGFVSNRRRHGRDMVIISRICWGSILYLALSALLAFFCQPRFD